MIDISNGPQHATLLHGGLVFGDQCLEFSAIELMGLPQYTSVIAGHHQTKEFQEIGCHWMDAFVLCFIRLHHIHRCAVFRMAEVDAKNFGPGNA